MSEKVLYMEDDEAQARLVRKCLERAGYEVDVAEDGAVAPCGQCKLRHWHGIASLLGTLS